MIIDLAALAFFATVLFSEFSIGGAHKAPGALLWGFYTRAWAGIHELASYLLLTVMVAHLVLHTRWIQRMFCGDRKTGPIRRRTGGILMIGAGLLLRPPWWFPS